MKKRYIIFLLALTTALSLTACGNTSQSQTSTETIVNTEETTETNSDVETTDSETMTEIESTEIVEVEESEVTETEVAYDDKPVYEIVNGCYKGVPLKGATLNESWERQVTWKASNGVYIKVNDEHADYFLETQDGSPAAIWEEDPDANYEPNSDYYKAVVEFIYSDVAYKGGTDRYDPEVVNVDNLPKVSTVSEKKSSFEVTDEFQNYIDEWNLYHTFQATGMWTTSLMYSLQVNDDFIGCIAEGQGYLWDIEREDDYWKLTIRRNPSELSWHGILTCLKMVSPDAQEIYDAIYTSCYDGYFYNKNEWYQIGNSEVLAVNTIGKGYVEYRIK